MTYAKSSKIYRNSGSIIEAARIFDVSRPTIYRWLEKKNSVSLKDLIPKRPWRKMNPHSPVKKILITNSQVPLTQAHCNFDNRLTRDERFFLLEKIESEKKLVDFPKEKKDEEEPKE